MLILIYIKKEGNGNLKYLILVSHGQFAEGIKSSLQMFAGDSSARCFALCLHDGDSASDFSQKIKQFLQEKKFKDEDEFVVLADIIGGSPLTTFLNLFSEAGYLDRSVVLGGMNFSMALTSLVSLDIMSKEKLAETALSEGQKAMKQYEVPQATDDEDDI